MAKRIAFTITDNGIDGREPTRIIGAFWNEKARDDVFDKAKSKAWYAKGQTIVDEDEAQKAAKAKLDGIDTLVLGFDHKVSV